MKDMDSVSGLGSTSRISEASILSLSFMVSGVCPEQKIVREMRNMAAAAFSGVFKEIKTSSVYFQSGILHLAVEPVANISIYCCNQKQKYGSILFCGGVLFVKFAVMRKIQEKGLYMKKTLILLLAMSVFALSGCDMFRRLAGRPTAEELDAIRMEKMLQEEALHQARIDSLKRVEKAISDSIAVLDSIRQMHGTILNPSDIGGLFTTKLNSRYYIVVGAFKSRSNAETLLTTVRDAGYTPVLISFRNGFNAIGISPAEDLVSAFRELKRVKEEDFCPEDVWILVNE